jgi:hypothetical protein
MRILLYSPVSDHKDYILHEWITYVNNMKYIYPFDILLIDNSKNPEYHKQYSNCIYYQRKDENQSIRAIMADCDEIARKYVIENDYDYMFKLECDLFPPMNIIEELLYYNKPVIGCSYFIGFGNESRLLAMEIDTHGTERNTRQLTWLQSFINYDGTVKKAFQIGTGCILIHKKILNRIKFRIVDNDDSHADSWFHHDLFFMDIPVYLHTGIIPRHENSKWTEIYKNETL